MGASGADLLLSPAARKLFPFYIECKNQESLNIWAALKQAAQGVAVRQATVNLNAGEPLVIFRRNGTPAYAALRFDALLDLSRRAHERA
jgi:hypothetical protein